MGFVSIVISMFLIMNSIGHISAYLDLVGSIEKKLRARIIVREMFFALLIMVFFHFVGEILLEALEVGPQTVYIAGGLILFLIAVRMIFPKSKAPLPPTEKEEPFIFPIATPMIAGPSILTSIMLYAHQEKTGHMVLLAILVAWTISITVLFFAPEIRHVVGKRALIAVERLMGLILTMMAVEMLLKGIKIILVTGL